MAYRPKEKMSRWYEFGAYVAIAGTCGGMITGGISGGDDGLRVMGATASFTAIYYIGLVMYDLLWNRRNTG